jgi:hypothetical protein
MGWKFLGTGCWRQLHNIEFHNLYSLPDCDNKMHIYSENLTERDHLEDLGNDLGLDKRKIKFWKELIAYFPLI